MRSVRLVVMLVVTSTVASGCGRDPAQVRWDASFADAIHLAANDPGAAEALLVELAGDAPRAIDEGAARFELVRLLVARGRTLEAAQRLADIAETARRQDDRARAYYELGRIAEDRGRLAAAVRIYRNLVRTYPNLMPGERSLAHLLRIARARGIGAVDAHLSWTRSLTEILAHTGLADDLIYQAADEAKRRAELSGRPEDWARTEALFDRIASGRQTPLWNDAVWELSWIYHAQGRYRDEIAAMERILRTREELSLFGQNEHPYYWLGKLRIARLLLVELQSPAEAVEAYLSYAELFPLTIKKDDVRFFALCAALQAGWRARADDLAKLLRNEHPESRFLRRLDAAYADPTGPHCLPPEVER